MRTTLIDLGVVPSGPAPLPAEAGNIHAIEKAVVDLNFDVNPSHPSTSHAVNVSSLAVRDDDEPLEVCQRPPSFDVTCHVAAAQSVAAVAVPPEAKSASGSRSTLLTNEPSALVSSNWTSESTSPPKSDSGVIKLSGLRKKLGVKRRSKTVKKLERIGRRSKVFPSSEKIKTKIPVFLAAASAAGASTGASSTHEVRIVENNEGALTITPRSLLGQNGTSGS